MASKRGRAGSTSNTDASVKSFIPSVIPSGGEEKNLVDSWTKPKKSFLSSLPYDIPLFDITCLARIFGSVWTWSLFIFLLFVVLLITGLHSTLVYSPSGWQALGMSKAAEYLVKSDDTFTRSSNSMELESLEKYVDSTIYRTLKDYKYDKKNADFSVIPLCFILEYSSKETLRTGHIPWEKNDFWDKYAKTFHTNNCANYTAVSSDEMFAISVISVMSITFLYCGMYIMLSLVRIIGSVFDIVLFSSIDTSSSTFIGVIFRLLYGLVYTVVFAVEAWFIFIVYSSTMIIEGDEDWHKYLTDGILQLILMYCVRNIMSSLIRMIKVVFDVFFFTFFDMSNKTVIGLLFRIIYGLIYVILFVAEFWFIYIAYSSVRTIEHEEDFNCFTNGVLEIARWIPEEGFVIDILESLSDNNFRTFLFFFFRGLLLAGTAVRFLRISSFLYYYRFLIMGLIMYRCSIVVYIFREMVDKFASFLNQKKKKD